MSLAKQFARGVIDGYYSAPTVQNTLKYAAHNPGDAAVAGTQPVVGYVPKLVSNLVAPVTLW